MHSKVLVVNNRCDWHCVKAFHEEVVNIIIESCDYFLPEGEILSHVSGFMVASEQHHVLWVIQLIC